VGGVRSSAEEHYLDMVVLDGELEVEIAGRRTPSGWHQRARSSAEEHLLDMEGVTGSIPVAPTIPDLLIGCQGPICTQVARRSDVLPQPFRLALDMLAGLNSLSLATSS
jgi:hypothetical protein